MSAPWEIIHGDSWLEMPKLGTNPATTVVLTDPPWPNAPEGMFPGIDPRAEIARVASMFPLVARRAIVEMGCNSDPRVLTWVPDSLPFVRTCWLRYARPSYCGTILNTGDVAYVFGSREATDGRTVMPGEMCAVDTSDMPKGEHPCPRPLEFVAWLMKWFTSEGDTIVDPFAGSGTTGVAAIRAGRRFIGIERDKGWSNLAGERLEAESRGLTLKDARLGQTSIFDAMGTP